MPYHQDDLPPTPRNDLLRIAELLKTNIEQQEKQSKRVIDLAKHMVDLKAKLESLEKRVVKIEEKISSL